MTLFSLSIISKNSHLISIESIFYEKNTGKQLRTIVGGGGVIIYVSYLRKETNYANYFDAVFLLHSRGNYFGNFYFH